MQFLRVRALFLCGVLIVALPAALSPPSAVAQSATDDETTPAVVLPWTMDKVWYRAGRKKGLAGLRAFKASGDLTLTGEGIEFDGGKDSFQIPLANITIVSLGKLGRDVNTDWVVVGLREGGLERIIAFRDGRSLGYGQHTPRIYRTLKAAMKQLGGAHYNVPPGYQAYDAIDYQIALMYPEDWAVHIPAAISIGGRTPWGTILFSASELPGGPEVISSKSVQGRIADSATREFFLTREEAAANMNCSGFKSKTLPKLLDRAARDPLFGRDFELIEPPRSTPVIIAGCEGLRVMARGRRGDGLEAVVDLRMVARRDTLFIFGVRALASEHEALLETFEPVVAGARFAPAVE